MGLFKTYSEKEVKRIRPIVDKINGLEEEISKLTDTELKAKTEEFKNRYANGESLDDLLPEALGISNIVNVVIGTIIGIVSMIFCDILVEKKFSVNSKTKGMENNLLKTGIIVSIGLAIHNFPEGLAIGSGFEASLKLGLSLAIAICLHDIPEGISMAVPMKNGGMKISKVIFYVILSGITTGIGAFFGVIIGSISQVVISICLSFAAGAMLYIVSRRTYTRI